MYSIDMHVHSNYSDGLDDIKTIIERAVALNVKKLALTDHDCIDGIAQMVKLASNFDLTIIPGIEFFCFFGKIKVEILGFHFNFLPKKMTTEFGQILLEQQKAHNGHSRNIIARYNEAKIFDDNFFKIKKTLKIPGPTLLANWILQFRALSMGSTLHEKRTVLRQELKKNGVGFVPYQHEAFINPCQAIKIIHENNGLAFWAHPIQVLRQMSPTDFTRVFMKLKKAGLDGLEVRHPTQNLPTQNSLIKLAKENRLLICGGSDHHGISPDEKFCIGSNGIMREEYRRIKKALT